MVSPPMGKIRRIQPNSPGPFPRPPIILRNRPEASKNLTSDDVQSVTTIVPSDCRVASMTVENK